MAKVLGIWRAQHTSAEMFRLAISSGGMFGASSLGTCIPCNSGTCKRAQYQRSQAACSMSNTTNSSFPCLASQLLCGLPMTLLLACLRSSCSCSHAPSLAAYLYLDIKELLMLDTDVASHGLCLWRGPALASAIDLASSPFGDITLTEPHPAGRASFTASWRLAADIHPQLLLCLLLTLLLMSGPVQQHIFYDVLVCVATYAQPAASHDAWHNRGYSINQHAVAAWAVQCRCGTQTMYPLQFLRLLCAQLRQ